MRNQSETICKVAYLIRAGCRGSVMGGWGQMAANGLPLGVIVIGHLPPARTAHGCASPESTGGRLPGMSRRVGESTHGNLTPATHHLRAAGLRGASFTPGTRRDQCLIQETAFFFKQWGGKNKKAAGRLLEERTWDEMPLTACVH